MTDINDEIVFLRHDGLLSQNDIQRMIEALEEDMQKNHIHLGIITNILTIFIEMSQNVMNYSKSMEENSNEKDPSGLILVSEDSQNNYYIQSQNIVSLNDKEKIEAQLEHIKTLPKQEIRKDYRDLRRSGENTHKKGGGIGFYEIAKRCDEIKHSFLKLNSNKFVFHFKIKVNAVKE